MTSDVYFTNDDKLSALLKSNRPLPNEKYNRRIADTLWTIRTPEPSRIRSFAVRKPLVFACILILALALCVGTAFAVEYLFRNVFGNASTQIEEKIDRAEAQYPDLRDEMEGMAKEDAAALDSKMDFDATNDAITRSIMQSVADNAVIVGQADDNGVILSEFAVYDTPGVDSAQARHLYFGFAAPLDIQFADTATICIDGYEMKLSRWDVPLKPTEAEHYAILECLPNRSADSLPQASLITVQLGSAQFCFRYDWSGKSSVLPSDETQKNSWLAESEKLCKGVADASCTCLSAPITKEGITVAITDLAIEGNVLRINADIAAAADMENMYAAISDMSMRIKGNEYGIGTALNVICILADDFDFSTGLCQKACWEITLPYHASELVGEELSFGFTLKTREQADGWQPEYDFTETPFEFIIKIS